MIEITYYYLFLILAFLIVTSILFNYYLFKRMKKLDINYEKLSDKTKQTRNYVKELYSYLTKYRR